jgi:DNA-binding winged helix-turn-helix (wHTH) protein
VRLEFGEFAFDPGRQELRRNGEVVHLTPKAMRLLEILVENRPNVVFRRELIAAIWPDADVSPMNLKNLVADLRAALDDHEREGRFIHSIHGRGYAFTDRVIASRLGARPPGRLVVLIVNGERIVLETGENVVGRGRDANVVIDDHQVSRHHARIVLHADHVLIDDLQSKNGTFIEERRVTGPAELADGDRIRFGTLPVVLRVLSSSDEPDTWSGDEGPDSPSGP